MRKYCTIFTAMFMGVVFLGGSKASAAVVNMLLESNDNRRSGEEVYHLGYDSLQDLINNNIPSEFGFTQHNLEPDFSVGGLASMPDQAHPTEVPEPATGLIFGTGLLGLMALRRRRSA